MASLSNKDLMTVNTFFSQSADNSISELFGTWFNYVATGIAVALVSGVGVYALNSLLRS
jgi:hypothetical protein